MSMHSPLTLASPVLAGNHAGDNVVAPLLSDEEKRVADWMNEQLAFEIQRIRLQHADARPLAVKNTSLVVKSGKIVNRVEFKTDMKFDEIREIMISPVIPCPFKPSFNYVNVLLFGRSSKPYIFPYLFSERKKNKLEDWILINARLERWRHHVGGFTVVEDIDDVPPLVADSCSPTVALNAAPAATSVSRDPADHNSSNSNVQEPPSASP